MLNTNTIVFYTLVGVPSGYLLSIIINDIYKKYYYTNISTISKYGIITSITFFSFLRGYTGKDLITNIYSLVKSQ